MAEPFAAESPAETFARQRPSGTPAVDLDALAAATDRGAVMLDGEMIDEASRRRAQQTLARAVR